MGAERSLSPPSIYGGPGLACLEVQGPACTAPAQARSLWSAGTSLPLPTSQQVHEGVQMEAVPATPEAAAGHIAMCGPRSSRAQTSSTCHGSLCHVSRRPEASILLPLSASGKCPTVQAHTILRRACRSNWGRSRQQRPAHCPSASLSKRQQGYHLLKCCACRSVWLYPQRCQQAPCPCKPLQSSQQAAEGGASNANPQHKGQGTHVGP